MPTANTKVIENFNQVMTDTAWVLVGICGIPLSLLNTDGRSGVAQSFVSSSPCCVDDFIIKGVEGNEIPRPSCRSACRSFPFFFISPRRSLISHHLNSMAGRDSVSVDQALLKTLLAGCMEVSSVSET